MYYQINLKRTPISVGFVRRGPLGGVGVVGWSPVGEIAILLNVLKVLP